MPEAARLMQICAIEGTGTCSSAYRHIDEYSGVPSLIPVTAWRFATMSLQYTRIASQGVTQVKPKTSHRKLLLSLPLFLTMTALNLSAHADTRGYIDAVTADVEEFSSGNFNPPPDSTWVAKISAQNGDAGSPQAKLEDFSSFIKEKSPGSYIFYSKLPKAYQTRLHQDYLATGDLEKVKQDIFKYSREVKRQNRQ
ncbi:MAG: hypothetical protein ABW076_16195 [Candidatus Thiodiazotropha sp.]